MPPGATRPWWTARAHLLARVGRSAAAAAIDAWRHAMAPTADAPLQRHLARQIAALHFARTAARHRASRRTCEAVEYSRIFTATVRPTGQRRP
jgi:hypothetical protein